jgi:CheY-like chemotaxis protein
LPVLAQLSWKIIEIFRFALYDASREKYYLRKKLTDRGIMKQSRILVIDDSTTNIVLLEAILTEKGYQIETALNAKEAFMRIEKQIPNLILLDLLMPKVSGFDFLEQLRKNELTRKTPVIVISAINADDENTRKINDLEAVDFIRKPIDIQYLVTRVEEILGTR